MNDILTDRAFDDMVQWLDDVRDIHEQAHAHAARDLDTMQNLQRIQPRRAEAALIALAGDNHA
ncbi:MAG TPA: hypothetical protein VKE42_12740 [Candidatus Cybelea sp.]|nr:hypothetical protein [Candidatus Cybelea sp.]